MGRVSFHLSSANSVDLGNSKHEISLEPGLIIPANAKPQCYLHDLAFTNTVANVDNDIYKNASVNLGLGQVNGSVTLHVPSDTTKQLYLGIIISGDSYAIPLHSDVVVNSAYVTASMKSSIHSFDGQNQVIPLGATFGTSSTSE